MAGCLAEPDISGDNGSVDFPREVSFHFFGDLQSEVSPAIEHSKENAFEFEVWVKAASDGADSIHKVAESFQCEVFALYGDEGAIGGAEAVKGKQFEGRGAIDEYVIIERGEFKEGITEEVFAVL